MKHKNIPRYVLRFTKLCQQNCIFNQIIPSLFNKFLICQCRSFLIGINCTFSWCSLISITKTDYYLLFKVLSIFFLSKYLDFIAPVIKFFHSFFWSQILLISLSTWYIFSLLHICLIFSTIVIVKASSLTENISLFFVLCFCFLNLVNCGSLHSELSQQSSKKQLSFSCFS